MARGRRSQSHQGDEPQAQGRSVAVHVRERQRAVAERVAATLARPEQRKTLKLQHADRKKSAVSSTPFGVRANVRAQEEDEGWCGPWSIARQMIVKREEERKRRLEEIEEQPAHPLDDLMKDVDHQNSAFSRPSLAWKSNLPAQEPSSIYAKRQRRVDVQKKAQSSVPSLFDLCVDYLVTNFEYVETLGTIENDIRVSIAKELVARNQLDAKAFQALIEPTIETLEIVDCSGIPQAVMAETLEKLPHLQYLILTHAGRAFGPLSIKPLIQMERLVCLSIAGAYLLDDSLAAELIRSNPTLQSVSFDTCPNIKDAVASAVGDLPNLLELSLVELCFPDSALSHLATSKAIQNVKSLTLNSMGALADNILSDFLQTTGESLETLSISHNHNITDVTLSAIRRFSVNLRALSMNGLTQLTKEGLITLFTQPLAGLSPPPKLKLLELNSCQHGSVSDELIELVTSYTSNTTMEGEEETSYRPSGAGLSQLNVQGSTQVTDAMLEQLVQTSSQVLTTLNVSYCPGITDQGLGYLVSKIGPQFVKLEVWGCAQLTEEFLDGHSRVNDPTLEIVGVWMKKSGGGRAAAAQ
eukprot:Nitzschia sp. Nitz4//scaffold12_size214221//10191//12010//NITZ4_001475-RA/size214221-augustus-gene-0.18-mRNA-1//-1//CDS//3329534945//4982//frame0